MAANASWPTRVADRVVVTPAQVAGRLAGPELAPLVDELVRRFESGADPVSVTLPALSDAGNRRLADLLGLDRHLRAGRRLRVDRLASAVGAADVPALRHALVELRGPLDDRRSRRAAAAAARDELWDDVEAMARGVELFRGRPAHVDRWMDRVRQLGVPEADVEAHRRRLASVLDCLGRLPAPEPVTLAGLAADVTGSAHGLDPGRRVARLVLDALALVHDLPPPRDAEEVRSQWEQAGVVPDPLSSNVLVLGLRPVGDDPLAVHLRASADVAEPVVLTLRQLQRARLSTDVEVAYVVENPSILAEVAGRWSGPPLVCSSGRPSIAVVVLVRQLSAAGAVVHQHADFDPAGIAITRWLHERAGTVPWRMTAGDYAAALAGRATGTFAGSVGPTPWDPELAAAMEATGRAVHEESIREELLDSMGRRPSASHPP
jgi:uncharacterized protein (TIGR02679 family)